MDQQWQKPGAAVRAESVTWYVARADFAQWNGDVSSCRIVTGYGEQVFKVFGLYSTV